jgi:hypothetical protein
MGACVMVDQSFVSEMKAIHACLCVYLFSCVRLLPWHHASSGRTYKAGSWIDRQSFSDEAFEFKHIMDFCLSRLVSRLSWQRKLEQLHE